MTLDELYEKIKEICPNAVIHENEFGADEIYIATGFSLSNEMTGELQDARATSAPAGTEIQVHYFADDGNYGDANGMAIVETTKWTELDWEDLEDASDSSRPKVAETIAKKYAK